MQTLTSTYSEFVERLLLTPETLTRIFPGDVYEIERLIRLRAVDDATLFPASPNGNETMRRIFRALLLYFLDALGEAEATLKEARGDHANYVRAMVFRRQGDMENSRDCYSWAGVHPVSHAMHQAASLRSANMAKQHTWDTYLFTMLCEQYKFGARESESEILFLQRVEFEHILEFTWRKSNQE